MAETAPATQRVRQLLAESGALGEGHFRLSSGRHSASYVQCARLLELPARAAEVGRLLAALLAPLGPRSVLSPALGGLIIGHEVAAALAVPFRFCERRDGQLELRRGFRLPAGEPLVVVEDVVTTGGSAVETAELARRAGAEPLAVGAILRRGGELPPVLPWLALLELELDSWPAADCPLCAARVPLAAPGSRQPDGAAG